MRVLQTITAAVALLGAGCPDQDPVSGGWEVAFDPQASGVQGWYLSVWGPSHDDLYAAGGTTDAGALVHRGAAGWAPVSLPAGTPLLDWVHGLGGADITAVGNGGTILHWDGASWTREQTGTEQDLWGVFMLSPSDRWAVGGRGRAAGDATVLHDDGSGWRVVPVPALQKPNVFAFYKVWAAASDDVVIVGQRGAVLRWNGHALVEELAGVSDDLISVWGIDREHIVAVGGRSNGVCAIWSDGAWHAHDLAPLPGLNGVWLRDARTAHIVGLDGTLASLDLVTMKVTVEPSDSSTTFHSIFGDRDGHLTAVGGNLEASAPPWIGVAYTRALARGE